ncbi:MAG: acetyl-CoA decarbonylase/synthase complex subunit delta [Methanomassiliicoccales archaeon]|jgi:acetyl-CoA decarbonylase/synthase complex subunit delta|nr:acetyl-CoA decarbonylase/synthase complex subunit delta [Methanomassiliicoccales archaeon]
MVEVPIPKEKWTGKICTIVIGATAEDGGSRGRKVVIGGETGMPFLSFEGPIANRPAIAGEVIDTLRDYPPLAKKAFGDAAEDPVQWSKVWVEKYGVDLICLKLHSTNPEEENRSPAEAAETVRKVLAAVPVPLIVYGCGHEEKDAKTMEAVSNIGAKERLLLGHAEESAYKSIAAASMANNHALIAFSNLDINLAKQINILLTDFGVKKENIVADPLMASLGMGLEYSYSVNERIRLAALMGDTMLQVPMVCDTTIAWKAREATEENDKLGDVDLRAAWWEATTALAALVSGADMLIMRSPKAVEIVRMALNELLGGD